MNRRPFYLDLNDPEIGGIQPGDLLIGPRLAYLVTDAHPTESRTAPNRWTLRTRTLGPRPQWESEWEVFRSCGRPGAREIHFVRNPR